MLLDRVVRFHAVRFGPDAPAAPPGFETLERHARLLLWLLDLATTSVSGFVAAQVRARIALWLDDEGLGLVRLFSDAANEPRIFCPPGATWPRVAGVPFLEDRLRKLLALCAEAIARFGPDREVACSAPNTIWLAHPPRRTDAEH